MMQHKMFTKSVLLFIAFLSFINMSKAQTVSTFASSITSPRGLAFDASGNLYVASYASSGSIYKITPAGVLSTFASGITYPIGLAFDASGNLYVASYASSGYIYKYTTAGVKSTFASGITYPEGLAFDTSGNLYVASYASSGHIYKYTSAGAQSTFASSISDPEGLAFDASGNLYVASYSSSGHIYKYTSAGTQSTFASSVSYPTGLAFDATGNLYVANSVQGYIYKFTSGGTKSTLISSLSSPQYIAFDASDNLYTGSSTNVVVNYNLTISGSTNICAGTSVTFTATTLCGGTSPSYQWQKNGNNVGTGATTYTDAGLNNNDVITFVLSSSSFSSTITSNSITETVNPNVTPSVSITPSSTVITGSPITFTANPTNSGSSPIYQWQLNSSNVGTSVGSIAFSGSSQSLTMSPGITPGTGAYTVDCWFYPTSAKAGVIFGNNGNANQMTVEVYNLTTIGIDDYDNSVQYFTVPIMSLNTWYHLAVVRDGSNNETAFLNGVRSSTGMVSDSRNFSTASTHIGFGNNVGNYFYGNISNLRVVVGSNVYDPTQSSITVPTGPLTNVTNTQLLLLANSSSTILTDGSSTQTLVNYGATWSALNMFPVSTYSNSSLSYGNVISCTMTSINTCQTTNTATASYTLVAPSSWTGSTSTNWGTASNWSNNTVPSTGSSVTIPASLTNEPSLSADVAVSGITLNGSLNLNGHTLMLTGALTGTGSLRGTTTSSLVVNGTVGTISFDQSYNSLNNLTITSGSATLGNALNIYGTFTPTGGTLTTGSYLTLKSVSIASSAVVGVVGGTITGNVTVERYIPKSYRAYRDIAPEVYGAGSIFNNWQEGGVAASTGIFITGTTAADPSKTHYSSTLTNTNAYGLDYSINGTASAFNFVNGAWNSGITDTKSTTLDAFQGYRVLIRGARDFNLYTTPVNNTQNGLQMVDATTLRATGQLVTGTVTYGTTGVTNTATGGSSYTLNTAVGSRTGFSYIPNPYVCPVDWVQVYGASSNINASYWYLDPTTNATSSYRAYNALTGSSIIYSDEQNAGQYIQAGQAVFVQATTSNPSVVFNESAKVPSSTKLSVFGATNALSKIYISLLKQVNGNATVTDGAAIAFSSRFSNNYGAQDALKLSNANDNISISDKGQSLSIDGRLPATATDVLPLTLGQLSTTAYQLKVDASAYISNGFAPYLLDSYKNTTTAINGIDSIAFTVDAAIAATYQNRFSIIFQPSALPVSAITASATLNNGIATITWKAVGEGNVSHYDVEKSTDGTNFSKIGSTVAQSTTTTYSLVDNKVVSGNNYYRIKAVSETGVVNYSNVALLTTNHLSLITVFPNPLKGSTLNIQMGNVVAGKYVLSIYNTLGEKVNEQPVTHLGGSGNYVLTINKTLASGVYGVTIREEGSKQVVYQTSLSVMP